LRASDVVASLELDVFGVLLSRIEDEASADRVAVKLQRSLQRPFSVSGQDIGVALAVGAAQFPLNGLDAEVLLRHALAQLDLRVAVGRSGLMPQRGTPAANDE
jgi:GGDEF domain-containing protein